MDGGSPDLVLWATAAVALYGALLASYNAWLTRLRERRDRERHVLEQARDERRVLVRAGPVVVTDHPGLRAVGVRVVNDGPRPVTLTGFDFRLEDGRQAFAMPVPVTGQPLPARLQDGEEVTIFLDGAAAAKMEQDEGTRIVAVRVHDASTGEWEAAWPRADDA